MGMVKLVKGQLAGLRFGVLPLVMLVFLTVRTFTSGDGLILAGICVGFLPFFAQLRQQTALPEGVSQERYILSRYLMYLFVISLGMVYVKGVSVLGGWFWPGFAANPHGRDLLLLAYVCNLAFISILTPLTFALNSRQMLAGGAVLSNIEIGFMFFAQLMLRLAPEGFALAGHWGVYVLAVMLPLLSMGFVVAAGRNGGAVRTENSR